MLLILLVLVKSFIVIPLVELTLDVIIVQLSQLKSRVTKE